MQRKLLLPGLIAALLCGCAGVSQAPYQRPEAPAKAAWSQAPAASVSAAQTISPLWWTEFRDPQLDALVARAIAGNLDLASLAGRIKVAQTQIAEVEAGAMPSLDLGSGASLEKVTGQSFSKRLSLGSQVSWDLDIWGRVARGVQAQTAEFRATEADWRAGYLQLVATVSTTYFQILQLDEQIEHQHGAIVKNERALSIFETMRANGLVPQTQVLRQRAENNRLRKELIELKRMRDVSEHALATLVGTPAGELHIAPGRLRDRVQAPVVPAGLPLDLLARRPDVVAAEFRVLEAYHLV
ncbi:MAG: TolC family protein, partial [Rhizobacter sp.]|nr:TolC family protein [Rhizobacter sp.]